MLRGMKEGKNKAAQQLGRLGGKACSQNNGPEHYKRMSEARKERKGWPKGKKRKQEDTSNGI